MFFTVAFLFRQAAVSLFNGSDSRLEALRSGRKGNSRCLRAIQFAVDSGQVLVGLDASLPIRPCRRSHELYIVRGLGGDHFLPCRREHICNRLPDMLTASFREDQSCRDLRGRANLRLA